jgi:acyl-coenzyme A synthetase/AMP-(fatty) acid ligase
MQGSLFPGGTVTGHQSNVRQPHLIDQINQYLRANLAHYKCPKTINFVTELPRTSTGKLQRFHLRKINQLEEKN